MEVNVLWRRWCQTFVRPSMHGSLRIPSNNRRSICAQCLRRSPFKPSHILRQRRLQSSNAPADIDPAFKSIVDNPATLVRAGRRHNKLGLLVLATIPITAFFLGCWQVQRLGWKSDLIARFEDRLVRDPLPLPPQVDPDAIKDFDYRRVYARGKLRHDQEMLVGPRVHDGQDGYLIVTPLDRSEEFPNLKGNTTILVCRGWIPKEKAAHSQRPLSLPDSTVVVQGLLREPWKKNMFTPDNEPEKGIFHFPDVKQMAEYTGSQAIWIEETMPQDLLTAYDREAKGIPIGRPAAVNLRNNHAQYIFTWFSLSAATTVMMYLVLKGKGRGTRPSGRVRRNTGW